MDPLDAIATIAERERCWFHVDAAYGGFFLLTEHGRSVLEGIERSDSVVLDPHKGLFLPYGAGIVVVRDAERARGHPRLLRQLHAGRAAGARRALPRRRLARAVEALPRRSACGCRSCCWGPGRSAPRWRRSCCWRATSVSEIAAAGFEVGPAPDLSIVTYRWAPPGASLEEANRINQAIVEGARRDGRVFLSSTMLDGRFTLRAVVLAFRTHRRTIDLAVRVLREQVAAVAG